MALYEIMQQCWDGGGGVGVGVLGFSRIGDMAPASMLQ